MSLPMHSTKIKTHLCSRMQTVGKLILQLVHFSLKPVSNSVYGNAPFLLVMTRRSVEWSLEAG